jgi:hypothetical protein
MAKLSMAEGVTNDNDCVEQKFAAADGFLRRPLCFVA